MDQGLAKLAFLFAKMIIKARLSGKEPEDLGNIEQLLLYALDMPFVASDANAKWIGRIANKDGPLTEREIYWVSKAAGEDGSGFSPMSYAGDDEGVTEDMLQGYADYLRNYLYTYKEEARDIDPSLDSETEHKGPMAQDIEKVAPDCVEETEEGVKTVDGNRLALVNAGVIGELARRVLALEEKLNGQEG